MKDIFVIFEFLSSNLFIVTEVHVILYFVTLWTHLWSQIIIGSVVTSSKVASYLSIKMYTVASSEQKSKTFNPEYLFSTKLKLPPEIESLLSK